MSSESSIPPTSSPFPPGTVVAGKYRVEKLLGEGGMGWVVVATHLQLEQRVALKFMRASTAAEHPDSVARFVREARAAARIQSEHVARVFDVGTLDNGSPYLVMEYLEGRDLEALVRAKRHLPVEEVIDYAIQACEGLAEAHAAGIVHRDLKPANLFLARKSDGTMRVKLLDFGISKLLAAPGSGGVSSSMTSTQALMGSPLYMSPEQLRSSKNVDRRTDIWSMGIILYELLGGRSPFDSETLPEVCARIMTEPPPPLTGVAKGLAAVVMRCLAKDPKDRFADVAQLAKALAASGSADARVAADRITRVVRAPAISMHDLSADASGPTSALSASGPVGVAQTNTSFGTARSSAPSRRNAGIVIAAGAAVLVASMTIALVATRDRHPEVSAATASAPAAPAASPVPVAPSTAAPATPPPPASTAPITADPGAPPTPGATDTAVATASLAPPPTATSTATASPGRVPNRPRPAATPAPTAAPAKPASTNGFGGRD
jgi:eukaryotic-like serine/threonine-protein kinase